MKVTHSEAASAPQELCSHSHQFHVASIKQPERQNTVSSDEGHLAEIGWSAHPMLQLLTLLLVMQCFPQVTALLGKDLLEQVDCTSLFCMPSFLHLNFLDGSR